MAGASKKREELIQKLKELSKTPMIVEPGVVKSVDDTALTCVVTLLDDTEIPDVRLKSAIDSLTDGLVQLPVVNSTVLVGMIGNKVSNRFVIAFSQVDKVMFYGGANAGLIKINDLVTKLNNLENKVNDIISKFNSHVHPGVQSGGSSTSTTLTQVPGNLTPTQKTDLENTKVLH